MEAAKWSVDRERLSRWVPEGERMTAGCAVTYGRVLWGMLPRRASLLLTDRRLRVLRHRGNDLRYAVRGVWFEVMRGEAEAVCRNPRVRVEFDRGREVELRRRDGGVERLLISQWDAVHADAVYEAFPAEDDGGPR
ncbi:hypothetical protein EV562_113136 [Streptomyces sp. BK208]|uniref:hypothetical protein n=1 Tax=Streptomyces sp. BK208 TaxID=2512150 RepID=UPI001060D74B|nr:hypothetical protein [Streptomyces sp. BK208]TDT29271.1 hypothetical protein EV562_113136 [Streptomyces sp. BK208]